MNDYKLDVPKRRTQEYIIKQFINDNMVIDCRSDSQTCDFSIDFDGKEYTIAMHKSTDMQIVLNYFYNKLLQHDFKV